MITNNCIAISNENNIKTYSTSIKYAFKNIYMYPYTITNLFYPFPLLLRRDYIYHLLLNNINPYKLYDEKYFKQIDEINLEMQKINEQDIFETLIYNNNQKILNESNKNLFNLSELSFKYNKFNFNNQKIPIFLKFQNKNILNYY